MHYENTSMGTKKLRGELIHEIGSVLSINFWVYGVQLTKAVETELMASDIVARVITL